MVVCKVAHCLSAGPVGISKECFQTIDLLGICLFLRKLFSWLFAPEQISGLTEWEISRAVPQARCGGLGPFLLLSPVQSSAASVPAKQPLQEGARDTGCCDCAWLLLRVFQKPPGRDAARIELRPGRGLRACECGLEPARASEVRLLNVLWANLYSLDPLMLLEAVLDKNDRVLATRLSLYTPDF